LSEGDLAILNRISTDDVLFVGNTRRVRREFILRIAEQMPIKVIGEGWDQYLPMEMVLGSHVDNRLLPNLYGKAFAVLNDHWPDMNEAAILSNRVVDVLSSGGLVVSDWNDAGAELVSPELFFRSPADAITTLQRFREQPELRRKVLEQARRNVKNHFDAEVTVERIFVLLRQAHERRMSGVRRQNRTEAGDRSQKGLVFAKTLAA
jgi:spore maturation protein CgeB